MDNFTNNLLLKDLTVVLSNNNLVKKYTLEPENVASNYNETIPSSFDISSVKVKDTECPNISVSSININKKLAAYSKYSTLKCQKFELVQKTRTCTVSIKTFVSMTPPLMKSDIRDWLVRMFGKLRDLAPFAQFKKREKHPWRSVNYSN